VPPTDYEALCREIADRTGIATEPFARVVRHVRGTQKLSDQDVIPVLAGYLTGAQEVVRHADELGRQ
jgi:hypothetical protein